MYGVGVGPGDPELVTVKPHTNEFACFLLLPILAVAL